MDAWDPLTIHVPAMGTDNVNSGAFLELLTVTFANWTTFTRHLLGGSVLAQGKAAIGDGENTEVTLKMSGWNRCQVSLASSFLVPGGRR